MITPIIIPIPQETEPDTCPSCWKPEDLVVTCRHCKHEYVEDEEGLTGWDILIGIWFVVWFLIFISWIFVTLLDWLFMEDYVHGRFQKNSLRQELSEQAEWFSDIKF